MKITFCLRDAKADRLVPIHCYVHFNYYQVKIATGQHVHPKLWNQDRRRVRKGAAEEALVNAALGAMESEIHRIFLTMKTNGETPTPALFKARYAALKEPRESGRGRSFFDRYEEFIAETEEKWQHATLQIHQTAKTHLKNFEKDQVAPIMFDRIDTHFFERFSTYLVKKVGQNNETVWKIIRTVRVFLRWAHEHRYTSNDEYRRFTKACLPSGQKSEKAYITVEELQYLIDLDLSTDPRLERTRDLFIFQAHTGMRYGDVVNFKKQLIQRDTIRMVTSKNRKAVVIPILPPTRAILEKYDYELPAISNQKQNEYLKELMEKAGIDAPVVVVDHKGKERVEKTVPRYELIGTHSAKRTFITILRQRNVSIEAIMRATGNSRRTIETYIVSTEDDAVREIERAWR
ncbi:MAG: site-specific integrase [Bacteroidota bacterium]